MKKNALPASETNYHMKNYAMNKVQRKSNPSVRHKLSSKLCRLPQISSVIQKWITMHGPMKLRPSACSRQVAGTTVSQGRESTDRDPFLSTLFPRKHSALSDWVNVTSSRNSPMIPDWCCTITSCSESRTVTAHVGRSGFESQKRQEFSLSSETSKPTRLPNRLLFSGYQSYYLLKSK